MIIGSDGLWDVLSDQQAVTIAEQFLDEKDAVLASNTLVESARGIWEGYRNDVMQGGGGSSFGIDDISAIVIFF